MRWLSMLVVFVAGMTASADEAAVKGMFVKYCRACHGEGGTVEGGMNYITDLPTLIARKKIVPGKPEQSAILRRIEDGSMPAGDGPRPTPAEVKMLRDWIRRDAQETPRTPTARPDTETLILSDLDKLDRRTRRFQRYLLLTHLADHGASADELQTYRNALSKLLNSLSWHSQITNPVAIDPAGTILRIDLRWYLWDATLWNRLANEYPYGVVAESHLARAIALSTAARLPVVRADWLLATASRAPLYYDLLQLPQNLPELETRLRVDSATNIQQDRVMRVGFNGSGVSRFNRLLERHDSANGMYWRTYDFDEPPANRNDRANGLQLTDRRNLLAHPLGPAFAETPFQHAGGEAIFALPNGLHGYYLVKADNTRLDKAPVSIVSDPRRPDRGVEAGVSCMSCHRTGILPKADQVREHLAKNPNAFNATDADLIRGLYPAKETSLRRMEQDAKNYTEAVAKTGAKVGKTEAVSTLTLRYEADLDLAVAASELGLSVAEFRKLVPASRTLTQHFGALLSGGTITRPLWVQAYADAIQELHLGTPFQANQVSALLADGTGEADPLEGSANTAHVAAFSPDGRFAVVGAADRSLRIWDVAASRDQARLTGHTASIGAVAWHPKEKLVASAAHDGSVRIWDLLTNSEKTKLPGVPGLISGLTYSPGGEYLAVADHEGNVALWEGTKLRFRKKFEAIDHLTWSDSALHVSTTDRLLHLLPETGEIVREAKSRGRTVGVEDCCHNSWVRLEPCELQLLPRGEKLIKIPLASPATSLLADYRWVIVGDSIGSVQIFNDEGEKLHTTSPSRAPIVAMYLHPKEPRIITLDRNLKANYIKIPVGKK
ncbi:MAG: c-type cytochrome [Fimbriiglobus sp.]